MCRNCYDNCGPVYSDKCIQYTGEAIPLLKICEGDSIHLIEGIIIDSLLSVLDGTGITPKDVSIENFPELINLLKYKDATLSNLLQIIIDNQKAISDRVEEFEGTIPYIFDLKNLIVPDSPTKDQILQALINQSDSTKKIVENIPSLYIKNDDLSTLVNQIIQGASTTSSTTPQNYLKMVPGVLYPYVGSLSNFDSTGKGLVGQGFDKVYLYNGLNNTGDVRGRTLVGAVKNVPGATLDSTVDPISPSNPNSNYGIGDKFGVSSITLSSSQMPSHSHVVNDVGHSHNIAINENDGGGGDQPHNIYNGTDHDAIPITISTKSSFTNISIQSTGDGGAHTNVQPSLAVLFIIYIP